MGGEVKEVGIWCFEWGYLIAIVLAFPLGCRDGCV